MLGRSTGLEGEGNVNGEGVEDYELRQRLDRSGKDITGNPTAQDELIHGAKKVMKEKDQTENGVIADEETEIPETNLTYKDLKDVTGKTVEELVEEQGDEKSIIDIAKEVENKIKVAARECNVSVEGYVKELKKADGKDIDEKIANANEEIEGQYMGNNPDNIKYKIKEKKDVSRTLIFSVIAFALFVYIFYRLIKENDTKYVTILAIEALRNSNKIYNGL